VIVGIVGSLRLSIVRDGLLVLPLMLFPVVVGPFAAGGLSALKRSHWVWAMARDNLPPEISNSVDWSPLSHLSGPGGGSWLYIERDTRSARRRHHRTPPIQVLAPAWGVRCADPGWTFQQVAHCLRGCPMGKTERPWVWRIKTSISPRTNHERSFGNVLIRTGWHCLIPHEGIDGGRIGTKRPVCT